MKTKTKPDSKLTDLPAVYEPGFLKKFDRRTEIYQDLNNAFEEIVDDLGGQDHLSFVQLTLIERLVFLRAFLERWERQMLLNPELADSLGAKWVQANNSYQGLCKTVGLHRNKKTTISTREYVTLES